MNSCFQSLSPDELGLRFKQDDQRFKVILCYIASMRPAAGNMRTSQKHTPNYPMTPESELTSYGSETEFYNLYICKYIV